MFRASPSVVTVVYVGTWLQKSLIARKRGRGRERFRVQWLAECRPSLPEVVECARVRSSDKDSGSSRPWTSTWWENPPTRSTRVDSRYYFTSTGNGGLTRVISGVHTRRRDGGREWVAAFLGACGHCDRGLWEESERGSGEIF